MAESVERASHPALTRSDAWLLAALTVGSHDGRSVSLRDLIHDADWLNRQIPTFDEVSYGVPRLVAAGFATVDRYRFRATPKALALRRSLKSLPSDGFSDDIVRLEVALGAKPNPEAEDEDRSLGRLPGLEPADLDIAVRKHSEWIERTSRPLVGAARGLSRLIAAADSEPSFVIGGLGDELRLSHPWPDNGPVEYASVTVTLRGFRVGDQVCFDDGGGLPRFFDELAADWKGWSGERTWSSVDGYLRLACRHDGVGRVLITAHLAFMGQDQRLSAGDWSAAGTVELLPGSLDEIAAGLRQFLRC